MDRCCGDPLGPECIECGRVVCMACDDATDVYDRDGAPHKCHRACAGKAQDGADKASAEAPDFADEGSGPVGFATANDGSGPVGFANARAPMAVQTSVSPVLNMDEFQAIFTTSNDPHKLFTLSFATPPAVVGKLVKPAKKITKKPPKEKTEAKIDRFNPDIIEKTSDNTDALDDDEKKAGMRSRCVWYKNGHRNVQYTSKGYAGWCGQRGVVRARSGLPYERAVQKKIGTTWRYVGYPSHDGCAAKTLMSLPTASVTHIEEID